MDTATVKTQMEANWDEFVTQDALFQADKTNLTAGKAAIQALVALRLDVRQYRTHMKAENTAATP